MWQRMGPKKSLQVIAEQLRGMANAQLLPYNLHGGFLLVARDIEEVAAGYETPSPARTVTPNPPDPKKSQWDELRDIGELLDRVSVPDRDDRVEIRTATHRLEEIADSLEDAYEHARDY